MYIKKPVLYPSLQFSAENTIKVCRQKLSEIVESTDKLYMALNVCRNGGYSPYDFSGLAGIPDATGCSVRPVEAELGW